MDSFAEQLRSRVKECRRLVEMVSEQNQKVRNAYDELALSYERLERQEEALARQRRPKHRINSARRSHLIRLGDEIAPHRCCREVKAVARLGPKRYD
jgi:hypothetical protein